MPEAAWGVPLLGTPEELIEQLLAERARGVELFVLRFHDLADPDTVELFGRKVIAPMQAMGW